MEHVVKALQKPVMLKILLCLLLLFDYHRLALAASGGVMGGSDFSSFYDSSKSTRDSSSRSKSDSPHNTYSRASDSSIGSGSKSSYNSYSSGSDSLLSSLLIDIYTNNIYNSGSESSSSSPSDSSYDSHSSRKDSPVTSYSSPSDSSRKDSPVIPSYSSRKDSPVTSYSSPSDSSRKDSPVPSYSSRKDSPVTSYSSPSDSSRKDSPVPSYSSRKDSPVTSYSSPSDSSRKDSPVPSYSSRKDSPVTSYSGRKDSPVTSYSSKKDDSPVTSYSSPSDSSYGSHSSRKDSPVTSYSCPSDSSYDSHSSRKDSPVTSYSSRRDSSYSSHRRSPRYYSDNSISSNHVHPTPSISSTDIFLIMCFIAVFLMCCYLYHRGRDHDKDTSFKTSVFKLQVGLLGTARSLQKDLNEIAKTTNTSTSDGFRHMLQATIGSLLQHPDYYTFGYSCVENGSSVQQAEKQFQKHSLDERSKFDEETLVNLNNVIKQSETSQTSNEYTAVDMGSKFDEEPLVNVKSVRKRNATSQMFEGVSCNEYIVVTIIVAACGLYKLPPVKSNAELKKALQTLASVPSSKIMASVVLWTPQKKDDTLSVQELRKNYPLLYPL